MITINVTFKVKESLALHTERYFYDVFDVVSFRHLPETDHLYKTSKKFKSLVKQKKAIQEEIDKIINQDG